MTRIVGIKNMQFNNEYKSYINMPSRKYVLFNDIYGGEVIG